jgi:hypothetical protein
MEEKMTVQPNYQREKIETQSAGAPANGSVRVVDDSTHTNHLPDSQVAALGTGRVEISRRLLHSLEKSAQNMRHAAENIENRGLKLLLKVMAQERVVMYNALRQAIGREFKDPLDGDQPSGATSLQQGLQDIQTSMTVQRQGRESVALNHLLEEERLLIEAYSGARKEGLFAPLISLLDTQREHVAQFYERLQVVGEGIEPVVARVFDNETEGKSAVMRLKERGLSASQIDAAPMSRVAQPALRATAAVPPTPRNTIAAGAFSGAMVGGLIGLALAAFVWLAPQMVGWITVGPWALLIGATIIGAVFGSVFGFFIGQNKREDDLAVTTDGVINGEMLVVAYPQPEQVAMVEDVLQVHHGRELNR